MNGKNREASKLIYDFFLNGTGRTVTGGKVGIEIETQFLDADRQPVRSEDTLVILADNKCKPDYCELKLELGRHNLELNIRPEKDFSTLWSRVEESLGWLYGICSRYGYSPAFEPVPLLNCQDELLFVAEERDEIWVCLDGRGALERLCRCSSVQFVLDVNPKDAIDWINRLWQAKIHEFDYIENDWLWQRYIQESRFCYRVDRYGGPSEFGSIQDYVSKLALNSLAMHEGHPCQKSIGEVGNFDIELFLRSIWWHYRLRRFGDSLVLEIRPFSRRTDEDIVLKWKHLSSVLGVF